MKKIVFTLSLVTLLLTAGCGKTVEETALEKIQKSLVNLENYMCIAHITQMSNKGEKTYEVIQHAKTTGEYRIEVTAPEKIAGTVTIFNGKSTFQYNPRIDGSLRVDVPHSAARNEILLTSFIRNYLTSEETAVAAMTENGAQMTVLDAVIPGVNPYLKTERLWVDNKTLQPVKLVIYDEDENEKIVVLYKKIEYNIQLGEETFIITEN